MTILESVLKEEYERMQKTKNAIEAELITLPKGYVSKKTIRGKEQYYLQKREGKKIVSSYLNSTKVKQTMQAVARRKELEKSLRNLKDNMTKLKKMVKDE